MNPPDLDPDRPVPHPHPHTPKSDSRVRMESGFEQILFGSRWLMAPMYLGLVASLAVLMVVFLRELFSTIPTVVMGDSDDGILVILSLIDLTLAANLVLIVLFSGYENFVSKLDIDDGGDRPSWMGRSISPG